MSAWDKPAEQMPLVRRVLLELRSPLLRNGYALIANSLVSSGLGFVFWLLVARLFEPPRESPGYDQTPHNRGVHRDDPADAGKG